jgi:hypothetical protein
LAPPSEFASEHLANSKIRFNNSVKLSREIKMKQKPYVAGFDSSSAMLRATSNFLKGRDFPNLGLMPKAMTPVMNLLGGAINRLPSRLKPPVYTGSTVSETVSPAKLAKIDAESLAAYAVGHYPRRRYPAVMLGSSNGAAVHLCAALGIPWLPQSFLLPARRFGIHPHEPRKEVEWARDQARPLLDQNPDLELHHMLDPVQDLLTSKGLSYFRVKLLRLPPSYERFLEECLEPDGTIYLLECTISWPTTRIGERHIFQFGAPGGASIDEYFHGSPRVEEYLRRTGFARSNWDLPAPDGERPEAEWGFNPELRNDLERYLRRHHHSLQRLVFKQPEFLSPLVADLYRQWHAERKLPANRLLVESFILLEPFWTLRVGAVPFWMIFSTEPQDSFLEEWLEQRDPFDEIGIILFSHGIESPGVVPVERWRTILDRARRRGMFIGADQQAFPQDFAGLIRYHSEIGKAFPARYPLPGPFDIGRFEQFARKSEHRYQVWWNRDPPAHAAQEEKETMALETA